MTPPSNPTFAVTAATRCAQYRTGPSLSPASARQGGNSIDQAPYTQLVSLAKRYESQKFLGKMLPPDHPASQSYQGNRRHGRFIGDGETRQMQRACDERSGKRWTCPLWSSVAGSSSKILAEVSTCAEYISVRASLVYILPLNLSRFHYYTCVPAIQSIIPLPGADPRYCAYRSAFPLMPN